MTMMDPLAPAADPAGTSGGLAAALADELVLITCQLAELAYDLGSETATLRRHMGSLQAIDRITQAQLAIADVLRGSADEPGRIAAITLQEMADRIGARAGLSPA